MRLLETLEKRRLVGKKKRLVEEDKEGGNLSHRNKLVERNPPLGFSIALVVGVAVDAIKELVVVEIKQEPLKRRRWMQRRRCEREMVTVGWWTVSVYPYRTMFCHNGFENGLTRRCQKSAHKRDGPSMCFFHVVLPGL